MKRQTVLPENIASCKGLICKQALDTYRRLPRSHKRWVDPEDLIQEGMLAALETKGHVEGKGLKFSTYLYNSLGWYFDKKYLSPLRQEKRSGFIVEIDAPVPGHDNEYQHQLQGSDGRATTIENDCVAMFMDMCDYLSGQAIVVLAKGLLCGDWGNCVVQNQEVYHGGKKLESRTAIYQEIAQVARQQRVGVETLKTLFMEEKSRKKALEKLGEFVTIGMGKEMEARILECVTCRGRFSLLDVGSGRYVVETLTCRTCHKQMQKAPATESCFGKVKTSTTEGYSEADVECRLHCRDRKICRQFIKKDEQTMTDEKDPLEGVDLDSVDATATAKKKAAPKKPAPAKAAKAPAKVEKAEKLKKTATAEKPPEEPKKGKAKAEKKPKAPKAQTEQEADIAKFLAKHPECGPRLPHKNGSIMQYCFRQALEGCNAAKLEKEIGELGYNWKIMIMVLRRGFTGEKRQTHQWKLSEEGGRLQLSNVKYVGTTKGDDEE